MTNGKPTMNEAVSPIGKMEIFPAICPWSVFKAARGGKDPGETGSRLRCDVGLWVNHAG